MDRVVLGKHANTDIGVGLFVSQPGANVLEPEFAVAGNLMFDSTDAVKGSIRVIQEGQFTLTCTRKTIPATFPSGINFIEEAGVEIDIPDEFQDGTIPEIAIWYAVGNSSGYFHPWYTDVSFNTATGSNGYAESDITSYTDQQKLRHMDTAQFRGKFKGHPLSNFDQGTFLSELLEGGALPRSSRGTNAWSNGFFLNSNSLGYVIYERDEYTSNSHYIWDNILTNAGLPTDGNYLMPEKTYDPHGIRGVVVDDLITPNTHPHTIFSQNEGLVGVVYFTTPTKLIVNAFMSACHNSIDAPDHSLLSFNEEAFLYENYTYLPANRTTNALADANTQTGWYVANFQDTTSSFRRPLAPNKGRESFFNPYANNYIQHNYNYPDNYNWFNIYNTYYWLNDWRNTSSFTGGFSSDSHWAAVGNSGYYHAGGPGGGLSVGLGTLPSANNITSGRYDIINDTANGLYGVYEHRMDRGLLNLYGAGHQQAISTYPDRVKDGSLNPDWKSFGSKPWIQDPTKLASLMFHFDDYSAMKYPEPQDGTDLTVLLNLYNFPYNSDAFDITQYGPGGNHGFGPALGGAGSVDALNGSPGWDTYYCRYIMYRKGTGQQTTAAPTTPNTYHFTIKNDPETNGWGDVYSQEKFRQDSDFYPDKRYFNLVFPDDFIGTVDDSSTDKFYGRRSPGGKIYGNINIHLHIENGAELGSENYSNTTFKPESVIKFNLSSDNFIYEGNRFISLTITNNGQIVGGGGSGGRGSHVSATGKASTSGYGGGGGGAGSGSGGGANALFDRTGLTRFHTPNGLLETHRGVGQPGLGWGHPSTGYTSAQKGANGASNVEWAGDLLNNPAAGGLSATATASFAIYGDEGALAPHTGGDGGDVFDFVADPNHVPYIEIVNSTGGRIRSGGGGGGGGIGHQTAARPGVAGANTGQDAAIATSATYGGGFAGYLFSSSDNSYTGSPIIRNEVPTQGTSELTYSYTIQARHPDGTTRGTPGWSAAPQETKEYE